MIEQFVATMREAVPEEARIMLCQFRGDPFDDIKGKWRAYVLNDLDAIDERANVYLCVSAMRRNERGEFRRRKENFAGGLLLMIDDIGTGAGAKFPFSTIEAAPPTGLIETSRDNFQAVYFFDELVTDRALFESLIKAFIDAKFLGKDTGMDGVNRIFRPPAGVNGKAKHDGWAVTGREFYPERRYSVKDLASAFKLTLNRAGPRVPRGAAANKPENIRAFVEARRALRSAGMLKFKEPDMAGWTDMRCPWTPQHTGAADNGAAIRLPDSENGWYGAFKCHHGGCEGRGWRELTDWLAEEIGEVLELVNESAGEFEDYEVT